MKRLSKQLFLFSCTSLTVLATSSAFAEQMAYAPELEGGITASVGTFYAVPGSDNAREYALVAGQEGDVIALTPSYSNTEYDWGFEASLGYVFEGTANGIELSYRGLNSTSNASTFAEEGEGLYPVGIPVNRLIGLEFDAAYNEFKNEFNAVDLMISQFLDIGDHVQMRFLAGLAYVEIEQNSTTSFTDPLFTPEDEFSYIQAAHSEFQGWGPRIGADARYDFGQGFGIVAGGTVAYFIGDLDSNTSTTQSVGGESFTAAQATEDLDNHSVLNLRGNVGIDYVYYFDDEESTLGLELGYLADYYVEAINEVTTSYDSVTSLQTTESELVSASYSGPYLLLKGAF